MRGSDIKEELLLFSTAPSRMKVGFYCTKIKVFMIYVLLQDIKSRCICSGYSV